MNVESFMNLVNENDGFEFYIDTKYAGSTSDVKILITPHRTVEELANDNGEFAIDYQTPEVDNYKYVGNQDYPKVNIISYLLTKEN